MTTTAYDYDWLIIGSGFGGSVAALRLAEKGYRVGVLEAGRRYRDEDFAKTTWDLRRYFWAPRLGMKGVLRLTPFSDVLVGSGVGVGGGSLAYANTLYRPKPSFYADPQWGALQKWDDALAPHYATAERFLGVTTVGTLSARDRLLKRLGEHFGENVTFEPARVGVYLGEPGKEIADPYFDGQGPPRRGCVQCGSCMVGCRYGAKNTLPKNYLYFAEKKGVSIEPERTVVDIRPLGEPDGRDGYQVTSVRSGSWFGRERRVQRARGIVVASGALGTNQLLADCRHRGSLPRVSARLGELVRTNSESVLAVTLKDDREDFASTLAISSSIHLDHDTHIELFTYGRGADSMTFMFTLLGKENSSVSRPVATLRLALRHPVRFLRAWLPFRWSRRTIGILVMQAVDNAIRFRHEPRGVGRVRLRTEQDPDKPIPRSIPAGHRAAHWLSEQLDGIPQGGTFECLFDIPTTAHLLGGAVIGDSPERGVVDAKLQAFGYERFLICDGSVVPANPGVNPALTITALAEYAMSHVPRKEE